MLARAPCLNTSPESLSCWPWQSDSSATKVTAVPQRHTHRYWHLGELICAPGEGKTQQLHCQCSVGHQPPLWSSKSTPGAAGTAGRATRHQHLQVSPHLHLTSTKITIFSFPFISFCFYFCFVLGFFGCCFVGVFFEERKIGWEKNHIHM